MVAYDSTHSPPPRPTPLRARYLPLARPTRFHELLSWTSTHSRYLSTCYLSYAPTVLAVASVFSLDNRASYTNLCPLRFPVTDVPSTSLCCCLSPSRAYPDNTPSPLRPLPCASNCPNLPLIIGVLPPLPRNPPLIAPLGFFPNSSAPPLPSPCPVLSVAPFSASVTYHAVTPITISSRT